MGNGNSRGKGLTHGPIWHSTHTLTHIPCVTVTITQCCGLFLRNSTCAPVPLCFSKSEIQNLKSTNPAGSLDGAPIMTQSRRHKPCSEIEVSYSAHSQLAFDASLLFTDCSAIATATCDLRAAALLLLEAITLPPPLRPRRGLTHLGGCNTVEFVKQAQKNKIFGPRHVLATEA